MYLELGRDFVVESLEELLELDRAEAGVQGTDHLARGDVECREQARGAGALVVVAGSLRRAGQHRQDRRRAVERLDLRLDIDAENDGALRRPGACANPKNGTARNDRLGGTRAGDRISGRAGNDTISGGAGSDCLNGGAGNDSLSGGSGNDALSGGTGNDTLNGGPGRDTLNCGPGRDRAIGDRTDRIVGCERITRR